MRKVLIVSHGYPPLGGSGMLRTLKFSRHLPANGWQPCIITLSRTEHSRIDTSLLAEVPAGTPIYRSPMIDMPAALVRIRKLFDMSRLRGGRQTGPGVPWDAEGDHYATVEGDGPMGWVKSLLTTPDRYAGWYLLGTLQGLRAVIRHRPHAIYSTSPPPTAHLIAYSVASLTGLPLVVDLRDPWTLQARKLPPGTRRLAWSKRLEKRVFQKARKIICNTAPMAAAYRQVYPNIASEKFVVITNGFDPYDFDEMPPVGREHGPCCFTHTGEFLPEHMLRLPDPFLHALRDLLQDGRLSRDDVRVRLIGSGDCERLESFKRLVGTPPLSDVVEVVSFLPHEKIPAALAMSDVLLLFQNSDFFRMQIPAKVFEYIRAERPILAIAPPGASSELVESITGGRAVHPDDNRGMQQAILDLVASRGERLRRSPEELARFSRTELTVKLARILDEISGSFG